MADKQQKELIEPIMAPTEGVEPQEVAEPDAALKLARVEKAEYGIEEYQLTGAVQQALDAGAIRGQAVRYFLPVICQLRETDLRDARAERKTAQTSIDSLRESYHKEQMNSAVLQERLHGELRVKRLQNIFITLGGILLGCALAPLITMSSVAIFIFFIMGILMLLVGWLYQQNRRDGQ